MGLDSKAPPQIPNNTSVQASLPPNKQISIRVIMKLSPKQVKKAKISKMSDATISISFLRVSVGWQL